MMKTNHRHSNHQPSRLLLCRVAYKRLLQSSTLVLAVFMCVSSLDAQPPVVDPPAAVPPASTATPPAPNLPEVPNFDIDLGTEEFENFGEEGFQVEEKLSPAKESTVTAIKVAVGAVILLLIGFIAMKLLKRK